MNKRDESYQSVHSDMMTQLGRAHILCIELIPKGKTNSRTKTPIKSQIIGVAMFHHLSADKVIVGFLGVSPVQEFSRRRYGSQANPPGLFRGRGISPFLQSMVQEICKAQLGGHITLYIQTNQRCNLFNHLLCLGWSVMSKKENKKRKSP